MALKVLLIVFLSLIVGGVSIYLLVFREKELTVYDRLYQHCTKETEGFRECKVFLSDFKKDENGSCLGLVLPVGDVTQRDIEICSESDIDWQNPYEDYSRVIPVKLVISANRNLFGKDILESVEIQLLDNEKVYELLDMAKADSENGIAPIAVQFQPDEELLSKGYDVVMYSKFGETEKQLAWVVLNANFTSIKKVDNDIELGVDFKIDGNSYGDLIITEEFRFVDTIQFEIFSVNSETDIEQYLNLDDKYTLIFMIYNSNNDEPVVTYYDELADDVSNYFKDIDSEIYLILEEVQK